MAYTPEQYQQALDKARAAGDQRAVRAIEAQMNQATPMPIVRNAPTRDTLERAYWGATRAGDERSKRAIMRAMQAEGINISAPAEPLTDWAAERTAQDDPVYDNFLAAAGYGAGQGLKGMGQFAESTNPALAARKQLSGNSLMDGTFAPNPEADKALMDTVGGMGGNVIGQTLPWVPAGGMVNSARGAAILGGLQGASVPLPDDQNNLQNRAIPAVIGAGTGYGAYRGLNSLADKANGMRAGNYANPEHAETMAAAERISQRTGLPAEVTAGDLGRPIPRTLEDVVFANAPLSGRLSQMTRQQKAVTAAAAKIEAGIPQLTDQPEVVIQRSLMQSLRDRKIEAGKLFDEVNRRAVQSGAGPVQTERFANYIRQALNEYPDILKALGNTPLRRRLERLNLGEGPGGVTMSFAETRALRSELGKHVEAARKRVLTGAPGASDEALHYSRMYGALLDDQEAWGQQVGGGVMNALSLANGQYKAKVIPFREQAELRRLVDPDANAQTAGAIPGKDAYIATDRLMEALTPEGQDALRAGVLRKAFDDAKREDGRISLRKLINNLPTGRAGERMFSPQDWQAINDLARYGRAVDRSLDVGNTPLTGKQMAMLALPGAGASYAGGPLGLFGLMAGGNIGRRVVSGPLARSFLHTEAMPANGALPRLFRSQGPLPINSEAQYEYQQRAALG